jgi:hypothetical protein
MPASFDPQRDPAGPTGDTRSDDTFEQTYQTGESCRLQVDNPRGVIRVSAWDRPEVHVRATKLPDSSAARYAATRIEAQQDGATVVLRTVLDPAGPVGEAGTYPVLAAELVRAFADLIRTNKPAAVDYEVRVPRSADLELHGVSSDVIVEGVRGAVRVATVSGSQSLANVEGSLGLRSVSGNVDGRGLRGPLDAESVSGDVRLDGSFVGARGRSVSGQVYLAGPLAADTGYEFHTVSGDVTLLVPSSTGATVDVHGVSPDVISELPGDVAQSARGPGFRAWRGRLNGGGAAIHFETVSGNLRLLPLDVQPAHEAPEPPAPAATVAGAAPEQRPEPDDEESSQLTVLKALERGEISVDQALERLGARRANDV